MTVLVDAVNKKEDTIPHEYAHHYIAWFRNTPIVQEAIKRFGSEEALVQAIGEQVVKQKGEAYNWWKKFTNWILNLLSDKQLLQILTDSFLNRQDLHDFTYNQPNTQQKQQAKQLYSQYLDTIFPDSKVKDIVYAGSKEKFDKFKIGDTDNKKDFGIYFGSWISHYFGESERRYLNRTTALINITNPRIINSITINSENNNDVENNEAIILSSADASNIKQFYNMGKEDGIIQLGYSHSNDEVDYKDSEDIYNKEVVELLEKVIKEVKTIGIEAYFDKLADNPAMQKEGHVALKQAINSGITLGNTLEEAVVFEPEQIHILGSNQDIKMFRSFVNNIDISLMPNSISDNKANYTFKSFNILMSDKAKQIFDKGNKNKWSLDKILTELAIPKEQKQLLLDLGINDREQLALELASKYGFIS